MKKFPWVNKPLTQTWRKYLFFCGAQGNGDGGYNSAFIPDRGSLNNKYKQNNGWVGHFTEGGGQLRKYSNLS